MTFKLLLRYAYRVLRISVIFKMKMHYNESVRKSVYKTKNLWTTCENGNHLLQCGQTITFEKTTFALWINCHVCCKFILMTCLYDMKNSKASKLDPWPKHPFHQPATQQPSYLFTCQPKRRGRTRWTSPPHRTFQTKRRPWDQHLRFQPVIRVFFGGR